jgi:hypothetical protein
MEGFLLEDLEEDLQEYCEATPPRKATMEHRNSDNTLRQHVHMQDAVAITIECNASYGERRAGSVNEQAQNIR